MQSQHHLVTLHCSSFATRWSDLTAAASSLCDDAIHPPEIYTEMTLWSKLTGRYLFWHLICVVIIAKDILTLGVEMYVYLHLMLRSKKDIMEYVNGNVFWHLI